MKIKPFTKRLEDLNRLVELQSSDGNWNYDPYMHGLANGLILSQAIIENAEPRYKEAPSTWLHDKRAQISRSPRSYDFTPGTAELYEDGVMLSGTPISQLQQSPQSNQWSSSVPSGLGKGLSEEQLFQQLRRRMKQISRDDLMRLQQQYRRHAIIAPIVQAMLADQELQQLVGNTNDHSI